jgi:hypothetical protein
LLPLQGKVRRIEIQGTDRAVLGTITDPEQIRKVEDGIADASVDTDYSWRQPSYWVRFVLNDGTSTPDVGQWDVQQAHLGYLALPADVNSILRTAL